MTILFRNETVFIKMNITEHDLVSDTRMCLGRGEGEEEIANQGWVKSQSSFAGNGSNGSANTKDWCQRAEANVHRKMNYSESKCRMHEILRLNSPFFLFECRGNTI